MEENKINNYIKKLESRDKFVQQILKTTENPNRYLELSMQSKVLKDIIEELEFLSSK